MGTNSKLIPLFIAALLASVSALAEEPKNVVKVLVSYSSVMDNGVVKDTPVYQEVVLGERVVWHSPPFCDFVRNTLKGYETHTVVRADLSTLEIKQPIVERFSYNGICDERTMNQ